MDALGPLGDREKAEPFLCLMCVCTCTPPKHFGGESLRNVSLHGWEAYNFTCIFVKLRIGEKVKTVALIANYQETF